MARKEIKRLNLKTLEKRHSSNENTSKAINDTKMERRKPHYLKQNCHRYKIPMAYILVEGFLLKGFLLFLVQNQMQNVAL